MRLVGNCIVALQLYVSQFPGPLTFLDAQEENRLKQFILYMSRIGFGLHIRDIPHCEEHA